MRVEPKPAADIPAGRLGRVLVIFDPPHEQVKLAVAVPVNHAEAAVVGGPLCPRHKRPTLLVQRLPGSPDVAEPGDAAKLPLVPLAQQQVGETVAVPVRSREVPGHLTRRSGQVDAAHRHRIVAVRPLRPDIEARGLRGCEQQVRPAVAVPVGDKRAAPMRRALAIPAGHVHLEVASRFE